MGSAEKETSKAYSLRITECALLDVDSITGYIAKHEPLNAILVGDAIFRSIDRIRRNPLAFNECKEIPTQNKIYRQAVCLSWLIIFKIKPSEVVVLGIIHEHRKPSRVRSLRRVK